MVRSTIRCRGRGCTRWNSRCLLPTADALTLGYAAQALAAAAVRLPPAIDDAQRTVDVGSFWALAGMSVVTGVKLDGSDSPFANQSLQSAQANLDGIAALYEPLSPLVHDVDAALDDEIHGLLAGLFGQLQGVTMTEQVKDKSLFCVAVPRWVRHFFASVQCSGRAWQPWLT